MDNSSRVKTAIHYKKDKLWSPYLKALCLWTNVIIPIIVETGN